jgi:hypothetical protein
MTQYFAGTKDRPCEKLVDKRLHPSQRAATDEHVEWQGKPNGWKKHTMHHIVNLSPNIPNIPATNTLKQSMQYLYSCRRFYEYVPNRDYIPFCSFLSAGYLPTHLMEISDR